MIGVSLPVIIGASGVLAGRLYSEQWSWRALPIVAEPSLVALEPAHALPRTVSVLAMLEAQRLLEDGRPYEAWETVIGHIDELGPAGYGVNLLAARAAAEWEGWGQVRKVLVDRPWLANVSRGDGLYYLALAEEQLGNTPGAEPVYRSYLELPEVNYRGQALARLALILSGSGNAAESAESYEAAAVELPEIEDWLLLRAREERTSAGETLVSASVTERRSGSHPVRALRVLHDAGVMLDEGKTEAAAALLEYEATILKADGGPAEAALLKLRLAKLHRETGAASSERDVLREVAADAGATPESRMEAAERLGVVALPRTIEEDLARAAAYEVAGRPGRAASSLRAALDAGAPETRENRLRLARLLYDEHDYGPARAAFQRVAEMTPREESETRADAELNAARSLFRGSTASRSRTTAIGEFTRIAQAFPGTAAAGSAHFLLGDEASSTAAGLAHYRQAAAVVHSPDAREALFRVGDRSLKLGRPADAIEAWEEYLRRYPTGEQSAKIGYDTGQLHETAGRRESARRMYLASISAEPTSYWAVRSGERAGVPPLREVKLNPRAWPGLASDPGEAIAVLHRLDRLKEAGLDEARETEYRAALRDFAKKPVALLTLAEGLRDRGQVVEAMQLGNRLLAQRNGLWDERLLRLVYPFPFRNLLVAEAERVGVDPMLYAGLVRQESAFRPRVRSRVGAVGLGQIMPATGRDLAAALGIREYDVSMLEVPEINVRMGTRFLGDLVRRYGGATDLALAGYNAGPARADQWRKRFSYGHDTDAFRAAIPFSETRNYVMVVLRNAAIYQGLYGQPEILPPVALGGAIP
ncbi:MAG: transglycosylase SLT domain-containing protein [Gemmatimonadota bacterium]|jgi:soluble lytic murein transglycosylase|nr:transglycosylase SLT domain-containing protein [Gemmatimonadota bacterium]